MTFFNTHHPDATQAALVSEPLGFVVLHLLKTNHRHKQKMPATTTKLTACLKLMGATSPWSLAAFVSLNARDGSSR
jgi:hypothetical protein